MPSVKFPIPAANLDYTGERFTTAIGGEIAHLHWHRYLFALQACSGKDVVDVASGEGYGSALLATAARSVTGIDVSQDATAHAAKTYGAPNLRFVRGDCARLPLKDRSVHVVVSFETVEHISAQEEFLDEIRRVLRPGGVLVMSSPDRDVYSGPGTAPNPFHVKELSLAEFRALISSRFAHADWFAQTMVVGSAVLRAEGSGPAESFRRIRDNEFHQAAGIAPADYVLCVATEGELPQVSAGVLDDRPFLLGLYAELQSRDEAFQRAGHEERAAKAIAKQREGELQDVRGQLDESAAALHRLREELARNKGERAELAALLERARTELQERTAELQERTAEPADRTRQAVEAAEMQRELAELRAQAGRSLAAATMNLFRRALRFVRRIVTLRFVARRRALREERLLARSGLFDQAFYAAANPDVVAAGVDPLQHYLTHGAREGRNPNRFFDTGWYLAEYPDVARSGMNPLLHYMKHGASEGRRPSPSFDSAFYLRANADVAASGMNPLAHFILHGAAEGRSGLPPRTAGASPFPRSADPASRKGLDTKAGAELSRLRARRDLERLAHKPLISVLLPTYNSKAWYLEIVLDSILAQTYPHWELCICDDGSRSEETLRTLDEYAAKDPRIRLIRNAKNGGISRATNAALAAARGEFVSMVDHDDEVLPDALFEIVRALNADPGLDAVYTDQDYIEAEGTAGDALRKPDWSLELFRGVMYVGHLLAVRRELANALHGFDPAFDNVQDYEFMLRVAEQTTRIGHVPKILYRWRRVPGSVAFEGGQKKDIEKLQSAAVTAHLRRCGVPARAVPHPSLAHRAVIEPDALAREPRVAIVVRTGDGLPECVESIRKVTKYRNYSTLALGDADGAGLISVPDDPGLRELLPRMREEGAEHLVFFGRPLEVRTPDWIEHLLLYSAQPGVGFVSPLVSGRDDTVRDAGLVLGMDGAAGLVMHGWPLQADGYAGSLSCTREVSAVSGLCFMISVAALEALGGARATFGTDHFRFADLSLRATAGGKRNVCVPRAVLRELGTREHAVDPLDAALFADAWSETLRRGDPYYNPCFVQSAPGYQAG